MEEIEFYLQETKESMEKTLIHLGVEFSKIRAGKASPVMLEGVLVEYYGSLTPLNQVAAVSTSDARTLSVKPFERKSINEIDKAIRNANLGLNPQNDGEIIRINIPMLTEERRKDLVKQAKIEAESAKVGLRNIRKDTNESLKKLLKEGASEDMVKVAEEKVQKLTDSFSTKIEEVFAKKEVEIMTI